MLRTQALLTVAVVSLLFVAFLACGGDEEEGTPTDQTPAQPAATTPTEAAAITPTLPAFSGGATATVTVGDKTFTFENGRCDTGPDEAWLAVNIGQPTGGEYFGLSVGADPEAPGDRKPAKGGGEFTGLECGVLSAAFGGNSFFRTLDETCKVTLDADLKGGEFEGTTFEGEPISGSFKC